MRSFSWIFWSYVAAVVLAFTAIVWLSADAWWQLKTQLVDWDGEYYNCIRQGGYEGVTQAFFPLFPLVWRWSGLATYGICLLNLLVFFAGIAILWRNFQWKTSHLWLYISTPMLMFMALPYTEALFFLFSVGVLLGAHHKNLWLTCLALALCSLTRPTYTILLPALIAAEWLTEYRWRTILWRSCCYVLSAGGSTAVVLLLQHADTGDWFGYIEAQKVWHHALRAPYFPLWSWDSGDHTLAAIVLRADGLAMLLGLGAALMLLVLAGRRLMQLTITVPRPVLIAWLYAAGIMVSMLLFKGGCINSASRYIFATAFFPIMLQHLWQQQKRPSFALWVGMCILIGLMGIFGWTSPHTLPYPQYTATVHSGMLALSGLTAIYAAAWAANSIWEKRKGLYILLCAINGGFTLYFMWNFLHHQWVA